MESLITTADVVIVGAGIGGLTAAYQLAQAGVSVVVLEKGTTVGGVMHSFQQEGFLLETGPNTFQSSAQEIFSLCKTLHLPPLACSGAASKRYLYHQEHLTPVPSNLGSFLKTPLLSIGGKCRLLKEPWVARAQNPEESVADFVERRLGKEVLTNLMGPFLSGVYAGNPELLSMPAVFPKLTAWEKEAGSLFKGAYQAYRARKHRKTSPTPHALYSFSQGMGMLPNALAQALPEEALRLSTTINDIVQTETGFKTTLNTGEHIQSRCLLMATPAGLTSQLLRNVDPVLERLLLDIVYAPIGVVHLGFPRTAIPHTLDGFGFLVSQPSSISILGCIWSSSLFETRAPQDHVLLTCLLGGTQHPEIAYWTSEMLLGQAIQDLNHVFQPIKPLKPDFHHIIHHAKAIPQYTMGHLGRVRRIQQATAKIPGLGITGNFLQGVSVNDCVKAGTEAATELIRYMEKSAKILV